jgi:flagellar motor switch protein FliG
MAEAVDAAQAAVPVAAVDPMEKISGSQRAAIFLLGVGEAGAASIMQYMEPKEVQKVGEAMAGLTNVSHEQIASVVQDFSSKVNEVSPLCIGTGDFTKRVMVQALGENRARSMLNKVMQSSTSKGIDALKWMDARAVAKLIKHEHPQIIAVVLASLEEEHAAQTIAFLPADIKANVMLRIGRLEMVDPAALRELDLVLEKQLDERQDSPPKAVNGLTTAAAIMNFMDSSSETELLTSMKDIDVELGDKIQELMFVFENLMVLDGRGVQRLIREISVDILLVALKGVDDEVQEKFLSNMSSRAAETLREDMEAKGPVKLSDVEAAQKEILTIAMQLAEEGEIFLSKGGGDFV